VHDGHRPDEEDVAVVETRVRLQGQRKLAKRDDLSLGRTSVAHEERSDGCTDEVRPDAHVADAEQQLVLTVAAADDRTLAEHERLSATLGARDLGEDQPGDEDVDESADVDLDHGDNDADPTPGVDHPRAVADRSLGLERVQHSRCDVEHVVDAWHPAGVVAVVDVAVDVDDSQVDGGERHPAGGE